MADTGKALEQRLRRLEDLEAIRQLFIDYGYHLDHGEFEEYGKLFADDGEVLLGPIGRATGPEAIRDLMAKTLTGRQGMSYHIITNPIIKLDGDAATTDVMWTVVVKDDAGQAKVSMLGRHRDTLVRQRGEWKFKRREGYVDIPSRYA